MKLSYLRTFIAFTALVLGLSILPTTKVHAAEAVQDQFCENAEITEADAYWLINPHTYLSQTFKPTKDHLTSVMLAVAGGADVNAEITAKIYVVGGGVAATSVKTTPSALVAWVDFTFPTITVDPTKTYRIDLTTPSNTARWIVSTTPCYADGKAYVNGTAQDNQDFGFVTYGFIPPTDTPIIVGKPSSLSGEYYSSDATIRLSWSKSGTAGVEGYRIYRSKNSTSNFTVLSSVDGTTLDYIDFENITPGKYYYYVRAFKDGTNSASSGTKLVTVPSPATPTPTSTPTLSPTPTDTSDTPTLIATGSETPTGTVVPDQSKRSLLEILMTTYFPQTLSVFALLLCGIIALIVLLSKPKTKSVTLPEVASDTSESEETTTQITTEETEIEKTPAQASRKQKS